MTRAAHQSINRRNNDRQAAGNLAGETRPVVQAAISTERSIGALGYVRTIAQLGIQIAEALEHAHDQGVVHRDIKPSNIILDRRQNVWITDFGLARIESNPGLTNTGDLLGTLRYMSPEQSMGKQLALDHRTDIYSLGVTLYELLTLHPAVDGKDRQQILHQIACREAKPPRQLNSAVPMELATIVLKAISKNANDRYDSAQAFADDLHCFLDHKPIAARRPTMVQRINKWSHRHPTILWSASILMLIVTVGSVFSAALIYSANNRTQQALTQSQENFNEAQRQTDRAEQNLDRALEAVENLLWRVGESKLANIPGSEQLRKKLLEDARAICQSFVDDQSQDPRVQLRSAGALTSLGTIQLELGNDKAAEEAFKNAIENFEGWIGENPNHNLVHRGQQNLAGAYLNLGNLYVKLANYDEAIAMYQTVLDPDQQFGEAIERSDNPEIRLLRGMGYRNFATALLKLNRNEGAETACKKAIETLTDLVNQDPADPDVQVKLGWAYAGLGESLQNRQDPKNAIANYEKAISIFRKWSAKSNDVPWAKSTLAGTLRNCAVLVGTGKTKQLDRAELLFNEALSIFRHLADQSPDVPDYRASLTQTYLQFAGLYREINNYDKSLEMLSEAAITQRLLVDAFPTRPDYRADLSHLLNDYSGMLDLTGHGEKSSEARLESVEHCEILVQTFPDVINYRSNLVKNYYGLASDLQRKGKAEEGEVVLVKAMPIATRLVEEFPESATYRMQLSDIHSQRANNLVDLDHSDLAVEQLRMALSLTQQTLNEDPENLEFQEKRINQRFNLAAQMPKNSPAELEAARQIFQDNLAFREKLIEQHPANPIYRFNYASCHVNLARTYRLTDRLPLAAKHFETALQIVQELLPTHPNPFVKNSIADYALQLSQVYADIGNVEKAMAILSEVATSVTEFLDAADASEPLMRTTIDIAIFARKLNQPDQSRKLLEHVVAAAKRSLGPDHELTLSATNSLGMTYESLLQWQSAIDCYRFIIDARDKVYTAEPANNQNSLMLGGAYCNRGNANVSLGNLDTAISDYNTAIDTLEAIDDSETMVLTFLTNSFQGRADAHRKSGQFAQSFADCDHALELATDDLRKSELQLERSKSLAQQGDYLGAARLADAVYTECDTDQLAFHAASVFAIAAGMALDDEKLTDADQLAKFAAYCNRSFELLEIARTNEYFDNARAVDELVHDSDWDAIRDDPRYRALSDWIDKNLETRSGDKDEDPPPDD